MASVSTYSAGQIVHEIIHILNTDTEPNDVLGHLPFLSCLGINACMAHAAGHANETVDTTEADADTPESGSLDDPLRERNVSRLEREHSASAPRHRPMEVVLRV